MNTKTQTPKLSIVFLNYNRLSETRYTLAILQRLLENRQDIEVIAVDNASTDGTQAFLQTQLDWVTVLLMDSNTGIAGYNEGFKIARGEYILVLDDDSHPSDNQTLDRLIQCLDTRKEVGVVACRIEDIEGKPARTWHLPTNDEPGTSMAFVGCGFAIRRELFEAIGWYPSEFFLYQNEIEVAIQVMRAGYRIHYDPNCRVVHRQAPIGRTNWRRVFYPTRNTIWLIRRYYPFPIAAYLIASRLFMGFFRALQSWEIRSYYQAVKEAFATPIKLQRLPAPLYKQLTTFRRQNSVFHQLLGRL
ncbi:glycosyltransferase family 2 protein [Beggiatoa leptomitoformis]|uniref:Glycosyltransferase n=1 Tax=Beggiatoa leptomitoformis TaxID=288004 RepID=A0A2N9YAG1_9GAMM|nr:glycosyltransferase family 2 protein [Beggiatoa leptomitoformis]ALG67159.1 glycosyltransferase [Beggiatoa leptomitoformis]AUI67440.1 glycosyltransferase [Beggiatoa leptomitoformis]